MAISRCICMSARSVNLSADIRDRIQFFRLLKRENERSAEATVTGSVHRICSKTFRLGNSDALHVLNAVCRDCSFWQLLWITIGMVFHPEFRLWLNDFIRSFIVILEYIRNSVKTAVNILPIVYLYTKSMGGDRPFHIFFVVLHILYIVMYYICRYSGSTATIYISSTTPSHV
jgi:hypothetical protein